MPSNTNASSGHSSGKKKGRRARLIVIVLVLAIVAGIGYGTYWSVSTVRASLPQTKGSIKLDGLSGPVDVKRDSYGIPQVYASSDEDLFMAQGYVQAQDRFWEMDVRRHMTSGRLSEMFGKSQVKTDEFLRTLGWHRVAQKEYDSKLSPETKKYLQAYAKESTPTSPARTARTSPSSTRRSGSPTTTRRKSGRRPTPWPGSRRWRGTCAATCRKRSTAP